MSRVGKNPINVPAGVTVTINANVIEAQERLVKILTNSLIKSQSSVPIILLL